LIKKKQHIMIKIHLLILFLLLGTGIHPAKAQYIPGKLSGDATFSILTVGPAEPAYTMFGHTALRLQDPRHQIDLVYKFLYGDLDYFLSVQDFEQFKQSNIDLGRSIVSQTLDISQAQINDLFKTLEQNSLPENRSYRYRFFSQNCVIQVVDVLSDERIWSPPGQIQAMAISGSTYRQKLGAYLSNRPWMRLGINLMLGVSADQPLTDREQNFLPNALHLSLANATNAVGERIVQSNETIATAAIQKQDRPLPPFVVFWIGLLIVIVLTLISLLMRWQTWWLDRILFGSVGFLGLIIAFGAFVSLHEPLHYNWNLLWALPTHLLVAIGVQTFSRNKWLRLYFWVTLVGNTATLAAWTMISQQLPPPAIPILGSLMVRSAFRLYVNVPQPVSVRRKATISNHLS
jgi:hypothetical protein